MRIVITGQTYYPGNNGQAIFSIHLAEGLARAGHEVHFIIANSNFSSLEEEINGVLVHKVRSVDFSWIHPEAYLTLLPGGQIRKIFRQARPEIVHIQDHYFLSRDVTLIAGQMGIPVMGTNHFLPENLLPYVRILPIPLRAKISIFWDLMLWTYNRLVFVTTPTNTAAQILLQQKIRPPVTAISCGVDTNHFQPGSGDQRKAGCVKFGIDPSKILLLYVGRLDREKRIDLLLHSMAQLKKSGRNDIHMAIAGQGAAGNELRGLAHELKIDDITRFLGYLPNDDLPLFYQTGHIFCMPSPEELQSIATLEAMASGLPILAANARALPELVTHDKNGYLFEPGKVNSITDGIAYLVDCQRDWTQMGKESRARAMTHSIENTIHQYEQIYHRALKLSQNSGNSQS